MTEMNRVIRQGANRVPNPSEYRRRKSCAEQYWDSPRFCSADYAKRGTVPGGSVRGSKTQRTLRTQGRMLIFIRMWRTTDFTDDTDCGYGQHSLMNDFIRLIRGS